MGTLFRRYWLPVLLSSELPEPDCPPVRVRVLCEDLVAFRATDGTVGLVDAYCPHRRAPMFFGRNEENGLRCVYHGWKFDVKGTCVDMPSEPPDSLFKTKVKIAAYPTFEAGDMVWAYLGPPELKPPPPDYELLRVPSTHRFVSKTYEHANYLQGLEGGLDTAHSSFAHNERLGDADWIRNRDGAPRLDVEKTEYGFYYTSTRNMGNGESYLRVYHYVMPAIQIRGNVTPWHKTEGHGHIPRIHGHFWLPIDDEQTWVYNFQYGYDPNTPISREEAERDEELFGRGKDDLIPGTFRLKRNLSNDYMIDRQLQKTKTFTGIKGINTQDFALQEGMGPIVDRSREHLGTTDRAIMVARQLLLEATDAVEEGRTLRATDPRTYANVRAADRLLPKGARWQEALKDDVVAKY